MVHFHQGRNKGTPKQSKIRNIKWITYNVQMTSSSRYRKWTNIPRLSSTLLFLYPFLNNTKKSKRGSLENKGKIFPGIFFSCP